MVHGEPVCGKQQLAHSLDVRIRSVGIHARRPQTQPHLPVHGTACPEILGAAGAHGERDSSDLRRARAAVYRAATHVGPAGLDLQHPRRAHRAGRRRREGGLGLGRAVGLPAPSGPELGPQDRAGHAPAGAGPAARHLVHPRPAQETRPLAQDDARPDRRRRGPRVSRRRGRRRRAEMLHPLPADILPLPRPRRARHDGGRRDTECRQGFGLGNVIAQLEGMDGGDETGMDATDLLYFLGEENELWKKCFGRLKAGEPVTLNEE